MALWCACRSQTQPTALPQPHTTIAYTSGPLPPSHLPNPLDPSYLARVPRGLPTFDAQCPAPTPLSQHQLGQSPYLHRPMEPPLPPYSSLATAAPLASLQPHMLTTPHAVLPTAETALTAQAAAAPNFMAGKRLVMGAGYEQQSGSDSSCEDSDPAALVEDALLGELFFHHDHQQVQLKLKSAHISWCSSVDS